MIAKISLRVALFAVLAGSAAAQGGAPSAEDPVLVFFPRGDCRGEAIELEVFDRDAGAWSRELVDLKAQVGDCDTTAPVAATGALSGDFTWRCSHGRLEGSLALAPTNPPALQELILEPIKP